MIRFLKVLFGGSALSSTPKDAPKGRRREKSAARSSRSGPQVITSLKSFPFDVVGESHYQDALKRIAGGYRRDSQAIEVTAAIALEPENRFDANAVRVEIDRQTVGYLPADEALRVGAMMREQGVESAKVEAQIRGGWRTNQHDQGHFGVRLKMPRSGWIDFGVGAENLKSKKVESSIHWPERNASTGPLSGEWIFLWGLPKEGEAAQEISAAGGRIMASIGKSTTIIVVDETPITPGMMSSASWRKMDELRAAGQCIEMVAWHELKRRIDKRKGG